jgi:hypothetical protein
MTRFGKHGIISVVVLGLITPVGLVKAQNPVQNWKRVEADNGAIYGIELNSITRFLNGTVLATTCTADNGRCPPQNWSRLWFDCRGHYRDVDRDANAMIAPPRSVVGQMADIACTHTAEIKPGQTDASNANPATEPYGECLLAEGKTGSFATSGPDFESGKSVLRLMARCQAHRDSWQRECVARGGSPGGPNGCTTQSYWFAYGMLRMLGQ